MMSRRSSVRCQSVPTIGFRNHHLSQTLSQRLTRNCHLTYSLTKLRNGAGRKSIRKVNLKAPKSFEKWPRGPHEPNPPPATQRPANTTQTPTRFGGHAGSRGPRLRASELVRHQLLTAPQAQALPRPLPPLSPHLPRPGPPPSKTASLSG